MVLNVWERPLASQRRMYEAANKNKRIQMLDRNV